ncbi:MAG: FliM/FliN family flagellar motor switch protein [Rhizobiaceae bacterium]
MTSQPTPVQMRDLIVERLTGETGNPDHVLDTARACAARCMPDIADYFEETLSTTVEIELGDIEICRMADVRLPEGSFGAMMVATAEISPDALFMTLDADAITIAVGALFGADPEQKLSPITRELSEIEVEISAKIFETVAQIFNGSGSRAFGVKFPLVEPIVGEEIATHAMRDGPAARMVFELVFGENTGKLTVALPQRVLLQLRGDATANTSAPAGAWRAKFNEEVMRSRLPLTAAIPIGEMTLRQIAGFHPGQVIEFPEQAQSQARLTARDQVLFVCELGKLGQNYTVRILQPFDAHEDFVEGLISA